MTKDELEEALLDMGCEGSVTIPEYESAVIGISESGRVVYDFEKMIRVLKRKGHNETEAIEHIDLNIVRHLSLKGDLKPIIMYKI